jgi:phosphoesterase RecJ-like protein
MQKSEFYDVKRQIVDEIKKWEKIIIHRHQRSDPDALGSQVGLAELIQTSFPEKTVYTAGEDNESLAFLATMNPPAQGDYDDALVIIVDTANRPRVDGKEALETDNPLIKIDHHPEDDPYGDIQWVDPAASSASEMITELWQTFPDELSLSDEGARVLYGGIVGDTNRFLYDATRPKTMRLAAELMEKNFSPTDLNHQMNEITPKSAELIAYVLEHLKVSENGVGSIVLTKEILNQFELEDEDTHQVVSLPGLITGVLNWGVFVEQEDGTFRCRLRSKGPIINGIAKEHGGGGHPLASGANAADLDEIEVILEKFEEAAKAYQIR